MMIRLRAAFGISSAVFSLFCSDLFAQGCPGLGSLNLNVVAAPQPAITGNIPFCQGGSITLTVQQNYDVYAWSSGQNTQSIDVNLPGTYVVTVTNSAGCTGTATQTVTTSPSPVPVISAAPYACNGQMTLNAGSGYAAYSWSSGQTTNPITVSADGTYDVTVTGANGCTGTDNFTVLIPPPPSVAISGDNQICSNGNGVLNATPGFSTYAWSAGGNGASITINGPGTYSVTATDAFGCSDVASQVVASLPAPVPTITGNIPFCQGGSITLTVQQNYDVYAWSSGQNTQSIDVSLPGTYVVTVTNSAGCTGTATQTVTTSPSPVPVISAAPYACNGQMTLNAGSGYAAYSWSSGQTTNPITVSADGTYDVTVTGANGCTGTDNFTVLIPPPPSVAISGDNQICSNGNGVLNATPGFSTYAWSAGGNGASITINGPGTYTVTATDAFGCSDVASQVVASLPAPVPSISGPASICANASGTLTVTGNFSSYNWSVGQNSQSVNVSTPGNYSVTVSDGNGCTGIANFNLVVNANPVPVISAAPYACNGQMTLNAGSGYAAYSWSSGQTTNPITVGADGTYDVTVTGANGCTGTDAFFVAIPSPPVVNISGSAQLCQGDNTDLQATPGLSSYIWTGGQSTPGITVFSAGTYAVTATDFYGCTASDAFTVGSLPAPLPSISGPASICSGGVATFAVPGSFDLYSWSNGLSTSSIQVNAAGTYSVTVTDANGCTGTAAQNLGLLAAPQPVISAAPYACNGQITLNAGGGYSAYSWSGGQSVSTITVTTEGIYSVTVTSANACTGASTFFADIPDVPVVSIAGNGQICQGNNTVLQATPGFGAYVWSNGLTLQDITVSTAGNYEVTATDGFGCTAVDVFPVQVLPNPAPQISGPGSICAGGLATFSVPGSFNAYSWSNGETTASITVGLAGNYSVIVTAANGCTGTDNQTLSISNSLEPQIVQQPYNCDGQVTLDAGAGFVTYAWSNSGNTPTISVDVAGDYTVTVSDGTGCTGSDVITVNIPVAPVAGISGPGAICQNSVALLEATPGFNLYAWSNNQVGPVVNVSQAGTYSVTVTDFFGCTADAAFDLQVNPAPVTSVNGPASICTNSSGTLSVAGIFSTYLWSTAETTPGITVDTAGIYAVTVTDALGCTGTATQTVTVVANLEPEITFQPYACNGQITLDASPGYASYTWSNGAGTPGTTVNVAGDVAVTVTDATGCTGTDMVTVNIPAQPVASISGNTVFCQNATTILSATPGFATYLWSSGQSTPDISVSATNNYMVTVTDALGCTTSATIAVTAQPLPLPQISGPAAICTNSSGILSVNGSFAAYNWSTAQTTSSINIDTAGTYAVTVTDALGCTGVAAQTVTVVANLEPEITFQPYACNGQITLDASPGYASYTWSNGANTPGTTVNATGDVAVTVTDATGCTGTDVVTVNIPAQPVASISGNTVFCQNATTILSATPGFAAYLWSSGQSTPDISVSAANDYVVTVTDALGCTTSATIAVTAQPLPAPVVTGPAILCPNSTGILTASGNFAAYNWSAAQNTASITVGTAGIYAVTVTDLLGCTGVATTTVAGGMADTSIVQQTTCNPASVGTSMQLLTGASGCDSVIITQTILSGVQVTGSAAVLSDYNGFAVACAGGNDGEALATPANGTAPFSYAWSDGSTSPAVQNLAAGNYSVTFTDANGCSGTASVILDEPPPVEPVIDASDPTCQNAGIIRVQQVTGGTSPYTVRLVQDIGVTNGSQPLDFSTLDAGTFEVEVTDANGCKAVEAVVLLPAEVIEEFVSDTFDINKGDTIVLNAGAGITIQPLFITWTPSGELSCNDCLTPSIAPAHTTLLELDVAGFGGCHASGLFLVRVKSGGQVYAPNAIQPGSADNFGFTIYGDDRLVNIRQMQVYDRWGNLMARFDDLVPNNPALGWDGRFRGRDMNPGVYVWWAEVEYSDGSTEILDGDVTVMR